jgi:hypothetical protein
MTNDQRRVFWSFVVRHRSLVVRRRSLNYQLDPFSEVAARHQDLATTGETACPNVGAQSDHAPLVAATRVRFTHSNHVVKADVSRVNHCGCCSRFLEEGKERKSRRIITRISAIHYQIPGEEL